MWWKDLKGTVHARKPTNITELKQFLKKKWAKIPPMFCAGLMTSYRKLLVEVVWLLSQKRVEGECKAGKFNEKNTVKQIQNHNPELY